MIILIRVYSLRLNLSYFELNRVSGSIGGTTGCVLAHPNDKNKSYLGDFKRLSSNFDIYFRKH